MRLNVTRRSDNNSNRSTPIENCFECASGCWISAAACLNECDYAQLNECIQKCLLTAEVCAATARALVTDNEEGVFEQLAYAEKLVVNVQWNLRALWMDLNIARSVGGPVNNVLKCAGNI